MFFSQGHKFGKAFMKSISNKVRASVVLVFALLASASPSPSESAPDCASFWYETTSHGSLPGGGGAVFVNAKTQGAAGDGVTDDTAAILRALNANQSGVDGSNVSRSARVVYLPAGTYLVSDTLIVWFWTALIGNPLPGCTSTLLLAPGAPGFSDPTGGLQMKPVVVANGGFNVSAEHGAWWDVQSTSGGHANDLFYASVRDISIVTGANNSGAVGLYWPVAQQTAVRNVRIDLSASGAIGLDMAGVGYGANGHPFLPSIGGGGVVDSLTIRGGRVGLRLAGSQWTYTNIDLSFHSVACVQSASLLWAHTFIRLRTMSCPAALALSGAIGSVSLIDSRLGPSLGASAIVTDGRSGLYLQNVVMDAFSVQTHFVVDGELPVPEVCCLIVNGWLRGPAYIDGVRVDGGNASKGLQLPMPSRDAARAAGLRLACPNPATQVPNLCGGSSEDGDSGIALVYRPSFAGRAVSNVVADFGAVGDGLHDDTDALKRAFGQVNATIFVPFGTYAVRAGEVVVGCNTSVVGEALSAIALFADAAPQPRADGSLVPMLATADDASCSATLVDLALTSLGFGNDGAVLLDHRAGAGSALIDLHMRVVYRVGLKAFLGHASGAAGTGAGLLSNCWWCMYPR